MTLMKKAKSRQYLAETITDADDLALLANISAQDESLLHNSLEQAAGCIGLQVNANKTEFMYFRWEGTISILSGKHLKLNKFIYLDSSISSTESDVSIHLAKILTTIDGLLIIWKPHLSNLEKKGFIPSCGCVDTTVWMHHMDANKTHGEKAR